MNAKGLPLLLALFVLCLSARSQVLRDTTFHIPVYEIDVRLSVVNGIQNTLGGEFKEAAATTFMYDDAICIVFDVNSLSVDVLFHESLHAVNYVCSTRGMTHDPENDEAQAYLIGYIGERVVKFLKGK
jgi:hypothetical protein